MEQQSLDIKTREAPATILVAPLRKQNCWEAKRCGREPGGMRANEFGVCPAAAYEQADGYCGGMNGGRGCAFIVGNFGSRALPGTHRDPTKNCLACSFYRTLRVEEGTDFFSRIFETYVNAGLESARNVLWNEPLHRAS